MDFGNKVILITGAGSGIGRTISVHFARSSAILFLTDINVETLEQAREECQKYTERKVMSSVVDLKNEDNVKILINTVKSTCGKINALINCAGIYDSKSLLDPNIMNVFDSIMNTNIRSTVALITFVTPALIESKGCIVNISSISAIVTSGLLPFNVEKAALGQLTKSIALELAPYGVRLNSVLAGPVKTNMLLNAGLPKLISDAFFDTAVEVSPMKTELTCKDIAELTLYLVSDKGKSITGTDFVLDCGLTLTGIQELITKVQAVGAKYFSEM